MRAGAANGEMKGLWVMDEDEKGRAARRDGEESKQGTAGSREMVERAQRSTDDVIEKAKGGW
jgi:hypothetical protein